MRIFTTAFMLLFCVCIYAQANRSMSIEHVVYELATELQNNSKDNEFQRDVRFRVTVNLYDEITIQQTWWQNNGNVDQMVLSFHPRDIIYVDKKYHKDAMGLAIECKTNAVANYWMGMQYFNNSVNIPCLKDDWEAITRIQETLLLLRELCLESGSLAVR